MERSHLRVARLASLATLLLPLAACGGSTPTATGSADAAAGSVPATAGQAASAGSAAGGSSTTAAAPGAATSAPGGGTSTAVAEIPDTVSVADFYPPAVETAPTDVDTAAAVFDKANDGAIEQEGAADHWTFPATAGQLLTLEIISVDHECQQDLHLVLQDPSGKRGEIDWVGNYGCHTYGPIVMEQDGQYQIELVGGDGSVISDATGAYRFVPHWLSPFTEKAATPGTEITGDITETLGRQRWTYEAEAGQSVSIAVGAIDHECQQDVYLVLEDPVGKRAESPEWIGNNGCDKTYGPFRLERAGTQVIEIKGGDGSVIADATGRYAFTFTVS